MTLIGCYVGNPHGSDRNAMANFEKRFDQSEAAVGQKYTCMNAFSDHNTSWDHAVENMNWTAWSWTQSTRSKDLIPIVGIPPVFGGARDYAGIVNGDYDKVWTGLAQAWKNNNFQTPRFRIGWEHNGSWYSWNTLNMRAADRRLWINAWRHIANQLKHVYRDSKIVWNPTDTSWMSHWWGDDYPGDDVVDIISLDIYSTIWTTVYYDWSERINVDRDTWINRAGNRRHYWQWPGANEWQPTDNNFAIGTGVFIPFARDHKKPMALSETGAGVNPEHPQAGLNDDAEFPQFIGEQFPELDHICVWDDWQHDGHWVFSNEPSLQPNVAKVWRKVLAQYTGKEPIEPPPPVKPPEDTLLKRIRAKLMDIVEMIDAEE